MGKYYTPPHLVQLVKSLIEPYIHSETVVMDLAAGCGAFLDCFDHNPFIIRDIDEEAVRFLHSIGYPYADIDNSLFNVQRKKYGLSPYEHIAIIGNPPYNDITSLNKKFGENAKQSFDYQIDASIKSSDLGTSFLRAFCKLQADVICVLHPLSYLIKEANFKSRLREFTKEYRLETGVVFSNNEFADTQGTPFPIVAALYVKDFQGMDYQFIRDFRFDLFNTTDYFRLSEYETIDGYIYKYSTPNGGQRKTDIDLFMHNFRDLNSLKTIGNISDKDNPGVMIPVPFKELYKYAYLNCLRRYFPKDYRWGNLSPLVIKEQLETDVYFQDTCIIDTILANQRLKCFSISENGVVIAKLLERYTCSAEETNCADNIYQVFIDYVKTGVAERKYLTDYLTAYFLNLPIEQRQKALGRNNS